jgi:hypothetical protein
MPGQPDGSVRRPLDVGELDSQAGEFSWGPGLTPRGLEDAAPSEGGRYKGQSPPCELNVGIP